MKHAVITVVTVMLMACSSMEVIPFPADPAVPEQLGKPAAEVSNDEACPDLSGAYLAPVEMTVISDNSVFRREAGFSDYFGLLPWAIAEKSASENNTPTSKLAYLSIFQASNESLTVYLNLETDSEKQSYKFKIADGDYSCDNGVLRFPARQSFGGMEGATINGQIRVSFQRTIDGALIALRTYGAYRGAQANAGGKFVHEFFRFEALAVPDGS